MSEMSDLHASSRLLNLSQSQHFANLSISLMSWGVFLSFKLIDKHLLSTSLGSKSSNWTMTILERLSLCLCLQSEIKNLKLSSSSRDVVQLRPTSTRDSKLRVAMLLMSHRLVPGQNSSSSNLQKHAGLSACLRQLGSLQIPYSACLRVQSAQCIYLLYLTSTLKLVLRPVEEWPVSSPSSPARQNSLTTRTFASHANRQTWCYLEHAGSFILLSKNSPLLAELYSFLCDSTEWKRNCWTEWCWCFFWTHPNQAIAS